MNRIGLLAAIFWALASLMGSQAFAQGKKVMVFEAALPQEETTFSAEPTGYSKLVDMLRKDGMRVASMSLGEITRQKIEPYDIIVLHPSPQGPLAEGEVSALVWFVAQKGGSLFIHGGSADIVNPLIEIFGIAMDTSTLIDVSSAVEESTSGRKFLLTRFPHKTEFGFGEAKTISFQDGPPLILSPDAIPVVTGDDDCYSDNGTYSIGSFPPVAAISFLGRGIVLVKSDRTMFNNASIENHQNMEWAKFVFQRLAAAQEDTLQRDSSLLGLRSRLAALEETAKVWEEERGKNAADLAAVYEKVKTLQEELQRAESKNKNLASQIDALEAEKESLRTRIDRYENPDTLKIAAGATGVILLIIFLVAFLWGRRTTRNRV